MADFDNLYNGKPRPAWAKSVTVELEAAHRTRVFSDQRDDEKKSSSLALDSGTLYRPTSVEGIVVPCQTPGRTTADVPDRDLSGRPEDRGHILALSLGGPNVGENMVNMPTQLNRSFVADGGKLSWRQIEVLTFFNACQLLRGLPQANWDNLDSNSISAKRLLDRELLAARRRTPAPRDGVYRPRVAPPFKQLYFVNNQLIRPIDVSTEQGLRTATVLRFRAVLKYRDQRGNSPQAITITIQEGNDTGWVQRYSAEFSMEFQSSDLETVTHREKRKAKTAAELRDSKIYKQAHDIGGRQDEKNQE